MVLAQRVVRLQGREKIARDEFRSLVNQLIKSVLSVRTRLAPDDGTGCIMHGLAVAPDALAFALHAALLEIGGEPVQVLLGGENGLRVGGRKVVIPYAQQAERDRQ